MRQRIQLVIEKAKTIGKTQFLRIKPYATKRYTIVGAIALLLVVGFTVSRFHHSKSGLDVLSEQTPSSGDVVDLTGQVAGASTEGNPIGGFQSTGGNNSQSSPNQTQAANTGGNTTSSNNSNSNSSSATATPSSNSNSSNSNNAATSTPTPQGTTSPTATGTPKPSASPSASATPTPTPAVHTCVVNGVPITTVPINVPCENVNPSSVPTPPSTPSPPPSATPPPSPESTPNPS